MGVLTEVYSDYTCIWSGLNQKILALHSEIVGVVTVAAAKQIPGMHRLNSEE